MGENSKIEWCHHTFNPWIGCTKVSAACLHCYAERDWDNRRHVARWGPNGTRVVTSDANWKKPIAWNRKAVAESTTRRVFCASLADVFEDWQCEMHDHEGNLLPLDMNAVRARLFRLIDATPNLNWLLVTKRPENIRKMWTCPQDPHIAGGCYHSQFRKNVWLMTSVENQEQADKRIPELLRCRELSPVLGLSCEPLLGPLALNLNGINWVITGNESGPGDVRIGEIDWHRSIRDQCEADSVAFLFKQFGEWRPPMEGEKFNTAMGRAQKVPAFIVAPEGTVHCFENERTASGGKVMLRVGKKLAGRRLDGLTHDQFPESA